jgi:hypothetical protein
MVVLGLDFSQLNFLIELSRFQRQMIRLILAFYSFSNIARHPCVVVWAGKFGAILNIKKWNFFNFCVNK